MKLNDNEEITSMDLNGKNMASLQMCLRGITIHVTSESGFINYSV